MGTVLSFQPRKRIVARPALAAPSTPSSVVIFPGVRYERFPNGELGAATRRANELAVRPGLPPQP